MDEAEATAKFAIRMAVTKTANVTGLRAGDAADALVDAVYEEIFSPPVRWAAYELANQKETA